MDWREHPIHSLKRIMQHNPEMDFSEASVDFKVYQRPNVASDQDPQNRPGYYERKTVPCRVTKAIQMDSVDELSAYCGSRRWDDISMGNKLVNVGLSLNPNHRGDLYYPQMDFNHVRALNDPLPSLEVSEQAQCSLAIYVSGRSYHGYGVRLMSYEEWVRYMGRMLLLNNPTRPDVVDPRWIGKSLAVNQSYLRMTAKSDHYLRVPCYYDAIFYKDDLKQVF